MSLGAPDYCYKASVSSYEVPSGRAVDSMVISMTKITSLLTVMVT